MPPNTPQKTADTPESTPLRRTLEAPCRLFVYLAREAPLGVVLRRGPSAWARLSVWHTDTDRFEHGQWVRSRVHERRGDLSPDGSLFVYFASKTSAAGQRPDSWLAISRPPWFTALALWFVGGTYHTGGFFPDRDALWHGFRTDPPDEGRLPPWLKIAPSPPPYVDQTSEWTTRTVYVNRLLRDGWQRVPEAEAESWERRQPGGPLTLVLTQRGYDAAAYGGPRVTEYAVRTQAEGGIIPLGRLTWADWDQRGRLVIARDGRLLDWRGPDSVEEIADFNPQLPEPAPAPADARTWPKRPRSTRMAKG